MNPIIAFIIFIYCMGYFLSLIFTDDFYESIWWPILLIKEILIKSFILLFRSLKVLWLILTTYHE